MSLSIMQPFLYPLAPVRTLSDSDIVVPSKWYHHLMRTNGVLWVAASVGHCFSVSVKAALCSAE